MGGLWDTGRSFLHQPLFLVVKFERTMHPLISLKAAAVLEAKAGCGAWKCLGSAPPSSPRPLFGAFLMGFGATVVIVSGSKDAH